MAKAHYDAQSSRLQYPGHGRWAKWDELDEDTKAEKYDCMWCALEMMKAATCDPDLMYHGAVAGRTGTELKHYGSFNLEAAVTSMIDKLREIT